MQGRREELGKAHEYESVYVRELATLPLSQSIINESVFNYLQNICIHTAYNTLLWPGKILLPREFLSNNHECSFFFHSPTSTFQLNILHAATDLYFN